MCDCKVAVSYNEIDFILTVEAYDYQPAERQTHNYPGCDAFVEATAGYVELDGDIFNASQEEIELIKLLDSNNAGLFTDIYEANSAKVDAALLQHIAQR